MNTDRLIDAALWITGAVAVGTVASVAWTLPAASQQSHDPTDPGHWYPAACCNLRDCFEVAPDLMTPTQTGWRYEPTGEVIPYDRVRQTPPEAGGTFHVCTVGGHPQGRIIGAGMSSGHCVWTPQMGG